MSRSTLLLLAVAVPAAFLVACGSDTTSGTTSTGGTGGSTATTGTGGDGGAGGSISTTGTGSSTATSSTGSTGSGTSSASGSTGSGMAMGACTNAADLAIAQSKDVKKITEDCGKMNVGMEPGTKNCIKTGTGFSDGCVTCFDDTVQCVFKNCLNDCLTNSGSAACTACREAKCNPAFEACSGLPSTP